MRPLLWLVAALSIALAGPSFGRERYTQPKGRHWWCIREKSIRSGGRCRVRLGDSLADGAYNLPLPPKFTETLISGTSRGFYEPCFRTDGAPTDGRRQAPPPPRPGAARFAPCVSAGPGSPVHGTFRHVGASRARLHPPADPLDHCSTGSSRLPWFEMSDRRSSRGVPAGPLTARAGRGGAADPCARAAGARAPAVGVSPTTPSAADQGPPERRPGRRRPICSTDRPRNDPLPMDRE